MKKATSLRSQIAKLEAENNKLKATMEYLWKLEFSNAGQYGYAVRASAGDYVSENIKNQFLSGLARINK